MARPLVLVPAVLAFLAICLGLAFFLTAENRERDSVLELLRAEARGDSAGVLRRLDGCDGACRAQVARFVPRLRGPGTVKIARLDSGTAYALGSADGWTRVVWVRGVTGRPIVQCVRVHRDGPAGRSISLVRVGAPLADNEGSC